MKEIVLKLYEFDELSKDSQERIIERERWNVMEQCMDAYDIDYKKSMEAFEDLKDTIEKCYNNFFKAWHEEYEHWADDEDAIREELHHNQYEDQLYYENGDVYDCMDEVEEPTADDWLNAVSNLFDSYTYDVKNTDVDKFKMSDVMNVYRIINL